MAKITKSSRKLRTEDGLGLESFMLSGVELERVKKATLALEDFAFFLKHAKADNILIAVDALRGVLSAQNMSRTPSAVARSYQSPDPNKHFLIGALPRLLLDKNLFPSNDDIIDFATNALRLEMKVEKRARFEIIGKIVCETDNLDEKQLTDLVRALERMVGDEGTIADMIKRKQSGSFSWNETLQDLLKQ